MRGYFKTFFLSFLLLSAPLLASPEEDAALVVQRSFDTEAQDGLRALVRRSYVKAYFRPIENAGLGIEIADEDLFMSLIPEADVAPFEERFTSEMADHFVKYLPQEYLTAVAAVFRADERAALEDIQSDRFREDYSAMLDQARRDAPETTSDNAVLKQIEEVNHHLAALNLMIESNPEEFADAMSFSLFFVFTPLRYEREIMQTEREIDNPVTIAAIQTKGVLRFANFTQRQSLLRQLLPNEAASGIQFVRPSKNNTANN